MGKCVVVVIDSFGVGAMDDVPAVRPQDSGANTCGHILQQLPTLRLPVLERLGLINALGYAAGAMVPSATAVYGTAALQHEGGDTFMGHQEILGTRSQRPLCLPFSAVIDKVEQALRAAGYRVERRGDGLHFLWVNQAVAVGDNLEADPGQVFNVSANLAAIPFDEVRHIGSLVRRVVPVGRVIAFGGWLESSHQLLNATETLEATYIGINAPRSGVYQHGFQVVHLGYGVDAAVQVPQKLHEAGIQTVLVGKVADIVHNPHGVNYPNRVDTQQIMDITLKETQKPGDRFICTNIQETDLAGHAQDVKRYAECLQITDKNLGRLMGAMQPGDCLIVMADHGNDPTIGHSKHTREKVPLLVWQPGIAPACLGARKTLSDVGATVCAFFSAAAPQNGTSFLPLLHTSAAGGGGHHG
ncbi:phosphopentomutase [Chimaeribacter californicus]|uniref:Phosphopentomutase n=1 Tax=Chimaeribacter californicus TaxID=2060067 RepID=A0A2N5EBV8_9GAMM|nr:phosphopentomutase [Chimaeribacter californicus]PLR39574.1 phosphopentomutase [Chimaeribacter californicus]